MKKPKVTFTYTRLGDRLIVVMFQGSKRAIDEVQKLYATAYGDK